MINKAPFIFKYKLSQKALSMLNIYKMVNRLKSQVLNNEESGFVADRQTCNQFFAQAKSPTNTRQTRSPPE